MTILAMVLALALRPGSATHADELDPQRLGLLMQGAAQICNTVKSDQIRGSTSTSEARGTAQAEANALLRRFLSAEGRADVSISNREFEGLTQDAYAAALKGDRECRMAMFDKLTNFAQRPANAPDGPRQQLNAQGVTWTRTNFDAALKDGDAPTVALFIAGGMRISDEITPMLVDNFSNAAIDLALQHRDAIDPNACSLAKGNSTILTTWIKDDARKLALLHAACASPEARRAVQQQLATMQTEVARARQADATGPARIKECEKNMVRLGERTLLDRATTFNVFAHATLTPEQSVYAEINNGLLTGAARDPRFLGKAIVTGCITAFPTTSVDPRYVAQEEALERFTR